MAQILHSVDDRGGGSAYCSNCQVDIESPYPVRCLKCNEPLDYTDPIPYQFGGSDF